MKTLRPVLAAHLAVALGFAVVVPLFEKPDEPRHLDYARFLARERRLPRPLPVPPWHEEPVWKGVHPPLYYAVEAAVLLAADPLGARGIAWNPASLLERDAPPRGAPVPPGTIMRSWPRGHVGARMFPPDARDRFPYRYPFTVLRLLRLPGLLWGVLTVFCAWRAARLALGGDARFAAVAAALVGLNPQFCFLAGGITNDGLANLCAALTVWLGLRHLLRGAAGRPARRVAGLGAAAGLGLLVKQTTAASVPFALACVVLAARGRPFARAPGWRARVAAHAALCAACVILAGGWWHVRLARETGDAFGLRVRAAGYREEVTPRALTSPYFTAFGSAFPREVFSSFWGRFGWMNIPTRPGVTAALAGLCAAGLAGLALRWGRGRTARGRPAFASPWIPWLLAGHGLVSLAGLVVENLTFTTMQGRYLFASLAPFAILLAAGLKGWAGPLRRAGVTWGEAAVAWSVVGLLLAADAAGLTVVWRAYAAG